MGTTVSRKSSRIECSSIIDETRRPTIQRSESETSQMSRKLWWSPKKSSVQIYDESIKHLPVRSKIDSLSNIDYRRENHPIEIYDKRIQWNVSPRIDSLSNSHWNPPTPRIFIPNEKLKWNAQPKVNSLDNIEYKPSGGDISPIYHQKFNFRHVQPRINTGFID